MELVEQAIKLSKKFRVFPVVPMDKIPAIENWPKLASKDEYDIREWWDQNPKYNIGLLMGDGKIAIDVDNKPGGVNGFETLRKLEKEGFILDQETYRQTTPNKGEHFVFSVREDYKNGTHSIGPGIDVKGKNGYILGAGSCLRTGIYRANDKEIRPANETITTRLTKTNEETSKKKETNLSLVPTVSLSVIDRAIFYLENEAPLSIQGNAGDQTAFKVACHLKEIGCSLLDAFVLMGEHWNQRCQPIWGTNELHTKIENAFKYSKNEFGALAPEKQFEKIEESKDLSPIEKLNKEFAFITVGGRPRILWETKNSYGQNDILFLHKDGFETLLSNQFIFVGDNSKRELGKHWIRSPERREYKGLSFRPGEKSNPDFYDLWKGYAVEAPRLDEKFSPLATEALEMFLDHAKTNICGSNESDYKWLISWCAYLIQKPSEKCLCAVVFKGAKGVGKNAFIEQIGFLLGKYSMVVTDKRYVTGNFNSHLEYNILTILDEAFWSGDKSSEGALKHLVTGKEHNIERKGHETYRVPNITKVAIIGNEDWLIPASEDERRYTVFNVGEGRKQDTKFFQTIDKGMKLGGNRLLFKFLMEWDYSQVNLNMALKNEALFDQKIESMNVFHQWWYSCLVHEKILGADYYEEWPKEITKEYLREAFKRNIKERQVGGRVFTPEKIGRFLIKCNPSIVVGRLKDDKKRVQTYIIPPLEQARKEFEQFIGHKIEWNQ